MKLFRESFNTADVSEIVIHGGISFQTEIENHELEIVNTHSDLILRPAGETCFWNLLDISKSEKCYNEDIILTVDGIIFLSHYSQL